MARDARQLREDAAEAATAGKHKRALECYLELERLEPTDAQWPKRAAETYRRLGKMRDAVAAFERAADRYAQNGFLVQAIAVCKLILQIEPSHVDTQQRLAAINAAQGAGPTRISSLSENHPSLHENPAVALLRGSRSDASAPAGRVKPPSAPPVVSFVDSAGRGGAAPGQGPSGGLSPGTSAGSSGSFASAGSSGSFASAGSSGSFASAGRAGIPGPGGAIQLEDPGDDPYGLGPGYDQQGFGVELLPESSSGDPGGPGGQSDDFFAGGLPSPGRRGPSVEPGGPAAGGYASPDPTTGPGGPGRGGLGGYATSDPATGLGGPDRGGLGGAGRGGLGGAGRGDLGYGGFGGSGDGRSGAAPSDGAGRGAPGPGGFAQGGTGYGGPAHDGSGQSGAAPVAGRGAPGPGGFSHGGFAHGGYGGGPGEGRGPGAASSEGPGRAGPGGPGYGGPSAAPVAPSGQSASQPIMIQRGLALESVPLGSVMAGAHQQRDDGSQPGIVIIPIDPLEDSAAIDVVIDEESARAVGPSSEPAIELDLADAQELEAADGDDIPLAAPRLAGAAARQALAATPLFAALNERQLESLIGRIDLMTLAPGQVLFREGEHGDSLLVVADGEVVVQAEGPPRVEQSVLSAGAFFGEVTLITDHPRMATVTALTTVEVLRIDRDALAFVLARHPEVVTALLRFVRDRLVERWMRTSPLCKPFSERQRREFASRFRFLEIEAGSVVMAPGDEADGLYIVLAGQFVVRRGGEDAAALGPGELIGETVLMTGEPLQSSVIANTKCLALWLPVDHFREVIMIHPHVLEYVGAQAERRRVQIY